MSTLLLSRDASVESRLGQVIQTWADSASDGDQVGDACDLDSK